jgi:DNA-directed RNA polymerase specialized sigma24 family protein
VTKESAKNIAIYFANIPDMLNYERTWKQKIEDEYYNNLKSPSLEGMPHGASVGRPTETQGIKAAEANAGSALKTEIERIELLQRDMEQIKAAIDGMNGKYKKVILWRHINEYSWTKISILFSQPESTVRYWYDKALERLGEILENDVVLVADLEQRASRAR